MIYSFVFQDSEHIEKEEMTKSINVKSPPSLRDLVRKVKFGIRTQFIISPNIGGILPSDEC